MRGPGDEARKTGTNDAMSARAASDMVSSGSDLVLGLTEGRLGWAGGVCGRRRDGARCAVSTGREAGGAVVFGRCGW